MRLDISLERVNEDAARKQKNKPKKGPLNIRRESETLYRRRQKAGIRFFDLGQILSGAVYERLDYYFTDNPHTGGPDLFIDPPGGTFFADLNTLILTVPRADFAANYKQIENGTSESQIAQVSFTDDVLGPVTTDLLTSPKFIDNKLKLSSAEAASLTFGMDNAGFSTVYDIITLLPNPLDTDVSAGFVLSKNADIYLAPQMIKQFSLSNYLESPYHVGGSPAGNYQAGRYGGGGFFFLDRALWGAYLTWVFMSLGYAKDWYGANSVVIPNSVPHTYNYEWANDVPFTGYVFSEPGSPINTTFFNSGGVIVINTHNQGQDIGNEFEFYSFNKQGLKAVIKQNNTWYYCWDNTGAVV